jgi:hypothetical protein
MLGQFSRLLMIGGAVLFVLGVLFAVSAKLGLGNLPGDLTWRRGSVSFAFPIITCIVISIVLTIVLNIVLRFFR